LLLLKRLDQRGRGLINYWRQIQIFGSKRSKRPHSPLGGWI